MATISTSDIQFTAYCQLCSLNHTSIVHHPLDNLHKGTQVPTAPGNINLDHHPDFNYTRACFKPSYHCVPTVNKDIKNIKNVHSKTYVCFHLNASNNVDNPSTNPDCPLPTFPGGVRDIEPPAGERPTCSPTATPIAVTMMPPLKPMTPPNQ